ncbi:MAG: hypothetical protein ACLFPS_05815 [Clostridia bacterium]
MGLTEDINEVKEFIKKQKEDQIVEKKFKFPFGKKVSGTQKKKNFVTVLTINENGTYHFNKYQIQDQTILHEKIPRLASAGYSIFDKKGNPMIILPSWSVEPFSPLEHYQKSLFNGTNKKGYQILMDKMLLEQTNQKKPIANWIKIIGVAALVGIIIYAVLTSGGS